jgi:hypothetical protein
MFQKVKAAFQNISVRLWHWAAIWKWWDGLIAVAYLGSLSFHEFAVAEISLVLCAFSLLSLIWHKNEKGLFFKSIATLGVCSALVFLSFVTVKEKENHPWSHLFDSKPAEVQSPQSPPIAQPTHTMLVRYSDSRLPIKIASEDTAYILQLNPNITRWVWEIPNPSERPISWPPDVHPKKGGPLSDPIYICTLTNEENNNFLDVSISFKVSFHELEMLPLTTQNNKDGTRSVTYPRPGLEHVLVTIDPSFKHPTAARDGRTIKEFEHSVSIPSLHYGQSVKIYLINQSAHISKFTFPVEATAIVAGDSRRIKISLVRPNITISDAIPWFGLSPATYHWKGVPGAP